MNRCYNNRGVLGKIFRISQNINLIKHFCLMQLKAKMTSNQPTIKRHSLSGNTILNKTKRNITKMVIYTSCIYLVGNLINPFVYFLIVVFGFKFEGYLIVVTLIGNTLQFGSYGLNMFVCYFFNNKYKTVLKQVVLKKVKQKLLGC